MTKGVPAGGAGASAPGYGDRPAAGPQGADEEGIRHAPGTTSIRWPRVRVPSLPPRKATPSRGLGFHEVWRLPDDRTITFAASAGVLLDPERGQIQNVLGLSANEFHRHVMGNLPLSSERHDDQPK